jgi:hypothetical protein
MKKLFFMLIAFFILFSNCIVNAESLYEIISISPFYDTENKIECNLYQYENFDIVVPKNLDTTKQLLTIDTVAENFFNIDEKFRKGINCIYLFDFEEERQTNCIGGTIVATYSNNNIYFYKNNTLEHSHPRWEINMFPLFLMHEVSHHYDNINKISCLKEWESIIDNDKKVLYSLSLNDYYLNYRYREEFASSMALYCMNGIFLKKYYPERYEFLSKFLEQ